ncbi:MAG: formylglycine-generating enzyme family protein, partial [bacterium]|nr:formylglycine-generating enzyme family protein [bacterium]
MADEKPEDAIFVIPVRLESCIVPERLSRWHYVDLFDERGVSRLLKALQHRANELEIAISPTATEVSAVAGHRDSGQSPIINRQTGAAIIALEDSAQRERVHENDGTVLVYVPGGKFTLGADDVDEDSRPIHQVVLSPFWIAKYPVTNEQYRRYLKANPNQPKPELWDDKEFNQPQQPVVGVSWEEAVAYCRWAGLELPSEAQWEAAARGQDQRHFPWGNDEPTESLANFGGTEGKTTPVGGYPGGAGPYGTLDQSGNVWEWCADVWDRRAYKGREGQLDPVATTGDAAVRVLRGGSWAFRPWHLAAAYRFWYGAGYRLADIGFRGVLRV